MLVSSQASAAESETEPLDESQKQLALNLLLGCGPSVPGLEEQEEEHISPTLPPQLQAAVEALDGRRCENNFNKNGQQDARNKFANEQRRLLYRAEKEAGLRLQNGKKKLRKLAGPHYMCISLHLCGTKQIDIAQVLKRKLTWVSRTLLDPLAQAEIQRRSLMVDAELIALQSDAVDALRGALRNASEPNIQLRGVEILFKSQGRFQGSQAPAAFTAEDIVKGVLEHEQKSRAEALAIAAVHSETHVHVHLGEDAERVTVFPDSPSLTAIEDADPSLTNSE